MGNDYFERHWLYIVLVPELLTGITISLQLLLVYVICGFISLISSFDI